LADGAYRLVRTFKHDFFAATSLYEGLFGKIVTKFGRKADFAGVPLAWLGRWLIAHECELYQRLGDITGVPAFRGRIAPNAFAHAYVDGHALGRQEHTPDGFFDQLTALIQVVHARGVAYVDLEKPENVLVGDDGRPYLIDFQIAWCWPRAGHAQNATRWVLDWIRHKLQQGDHYHLLKLRRRCRPDQLTPEQWAVLNRKPPLIRLHGRLTAPLQRVRRSLLNRVDSARKAGERGRLAPDRGDTAKETTAKR
jgi:hypothetical protein